MSIRDRILVKAAAAAALCCAGDGYMRAANAAGFELREQTAEAVAVSSAGSTAAAYNAGTVFYNPAGMTLLQGNQVSVSATMYVPEATFTGHVTNAGTVPLVAGNNGGNITPSAIAPGNFAVLDFSPNLKFGFAVSAPFGLATDPRDGWVGRYAALRTEVTDLNFQPSVAYRFNEHFSIGLGLQISYFNAVLQAAVNLPGLGLAPFDSKQSNNVADVGWGGDIGFLYEFDPNTRIGLNYRSRMHYNLEGGTSIQAPAPLIEASPVFRNSGVHVNLTLPDIITLGFFHQLTPELALLATVKYTTWSTIQDLHFFYDNGRPVTREPLGWRDSWFGSIGAVYAVTPQIKALFGVGFDQSAIAAEKRTVRLPDTNRVNASFGFSYDINKNLQANFGFQHIFTNGAAVTEFAPTPNGGLVQGSYTLSANLISVSAVVKY
jgi:long-chain fatty acid transport protein